VADVTQAQQFLGWVEAAAKFAIPVVAVVGASYTALQYGRSRRWRAGDLAASLISQLETDEELAFACRVLDWGVGPLIVPQRYRPLLETVPADPKNATPAERGAVIQMDRELLARAVEPRLKIDPKAEPAGLIYRYCFDKFFSHLANVHRLVQTRQVKSKDLIPLKYWLERIARYEYPPRPMPKDQVFQPFLEHEAFGYRGVIFLGEKLGVDGWLKSWKKPRAPADGWSVSERR